MLIGITGAAGSGKSTVEERLCSTHRCASYSLADPIKRALRAIFGWPASMFEDREKKEATTIYGKSPRQMAQTLGTEWGRNLINPDLWLMMAAEFAQPFGKRGVDVVIPDIRFENEATFIRDSGGVLIHVYRAAEYKVSPHSSEEGVRKGRWDYFINNNAGIEELNSAVDSIARIIKPQ